MAELAAAKTLTTRDRGSKAIVRAVTEGASADCKNDILAGSMLLKSNHAPSLAAGMTESQQSSVLDAVTADSKIAMGGQPKTAGLGASRSFSRLGHPMAGMVQS